GKQRRTCLARGGAGGFICPRWRLATLCMNVRVRVRCARPRRGAAPSEMPATVTASVGRPSTRRRPNVPACSASGAAGPSSIMPSWTKCSAICRRRRSSCRTQRRRDVGDAPKSAEARGRPRGTLCAMISAQELAKALGGDVVNGEVLARGRGHGAADRSLAVKLDSTARDGFVVHSFAGDDPIACRDYVRRKLGLPEFEPKKAKKVNGSGKPFSPTIAKYVYRQADNTPYLQVHRLADKSGFPQYHWDGEKWISGKPKGAKIPYMLPQLIAATPATPIYVVEGEKDVDNLAKIGFVATCNSEGADNGNAKKWTPDLNRYFKDRDVYILPDNDAPRRQHAAHLARNL